MNGTVVAGAPSTYQARWWYGQRATPDVVRGAVGRIGAGLRLRGVRSGGAPTHPLSTVKGAG